jgi:hypothetical protein
MRIALSLFAVAAVLWACPAKRAPGDEVPPTAPTQGQEPIQEVPGEPGGSGTIIGEPYDARDGGVIPPPADAGTPDGGTMMR